MSHQTFNPAPPFPSPRPRNITGIIGLSMVVAATILSPTGFLGMTLCLLVPLGFGGLVVCAVSLAWRPRWPGIVGLIIGLLCVGGWAVFFLTIFNSVNTSAARLGMSVGQHTTMLMSAQSLVERAERLRLPDGSPPASFDFAAVPLEDQNDPWGKPYRYALAATSRGYTFLSDGPDGVTNSADDIDLFTIQTDGTFALPPFIRRPAPAASAPDSAPGSASDADGDNGPAAPGD